MNFAKAEFVSFCLGLSLMEHRCQQFNFVTEVQCNLYKVCS